MMRGFGSRMGQIPIRKCETQLTQQFVPRQAGLAQMCMKQSDFACYQVAAQTEGIYICQQSRRRCGALLDPAADGRKLKSCGKGSGDAVGVYLSAKSWRVDVSAESLLRSGRPVKTPVLELFLILLKQVCSVQSLPLAIGTTALGMRLGSGEDLKSLLNKIQSWTQWGPEERQRMRDASECLVPISEDVAGKGRQHDWVLARVVPGDTATTLGAAWSLRVIVADRLSRVSVRNRIAEHLGAVVAGLRHGHLGFRVQSEAEFCPACDNSLDAILAVFGLLTSRRGCRWKAVDGSEDVHLCS